MGKKLGFCTCKTRAMMRLTMTVIMAIENMTLEIKAVETNRCKAGAANPFRARKV